MASTLQDIIAGAPPYVSNVETPISALKGNTDVSEIAAYPQIAAPATAPTLQILSTAGNLTGNYQYDVAFVTGFWSIDTAGQLGSLIASGNTGGGVLSATVSPSAQQVSLSNIPIGPTGTVARVLYRTDANGSSLYYLYQIDDNATTSWTDNTPDASLGAAMPTTNTTGTVANLWKLNASGFATFNAGLTVAANQTLTNNGTYAGSPLVTSLTATNGLSVVNPTSPGAASYSLVLNGTSLSNGASGLAVNLGNANAWTAAQQFPWILAANSSFGQAAPYGQGAYIGWGLDGVGDTDFLNDPGTSGGAWGFYNWTGSAWNLVAQIGGLGRFTMIRGVSTSGSFGVATVVTQAQEVEITGTTAQTILSFTPPAQGVYEIKVYFRVVTGTTTVTVAATYDDVTGAQVDDILPATSEVVGSYRTIPATIDATTAAAITVQVTASVANQVFATAVLIGY